MPQEKNKGDQHHNAYCEAEKQPNNKADLKCDFKTNNLFSFRCGLSIKVSLNKKYSTKNCFLLLSFFITGAHYDPD